MKTRWGIIGASGISDECTIPGILKTDNSEVVAVMNRTAETVEKVRTKYDIKRAYTNIDDLLKDEEVDIVYIATPVFNHLEQVIAAAKAKKHIFLEKPMGMNPEECEKMIAAAKENGVKLGIAFMMRFGNFHQQVKELLAQGIIGDIVITRIQYSWWYPDAKVWRLDPKLSGGGAVMDLGSHCIDLIQFLLGKKIKTVAAMTATRTFHYEVEDSAQVIYQMEDGTFGNFNFHFNIPNSVSNNTLEIYGTKGSITCFDTIGREDTGRVEVKIIGENGLRSFTDFAKKELEGEPFDRYTKEVEAFSRAVLKDEEPIVPAEAGLNVCKIAAAIYKSAKNRTFENVE